MKNKKLENLQAALQENVVHVWFTKKDGGTRLMKCTRNLDLVPEEQHEGIDDQRIIGEKIIGVYDFDNSAWRSFLKSAVTNWEVVL